MSHSESESEDLPPGQWAVRQLWRRVGDDLADAAYALGLLRTLPSLPAGLREIIATSAADLDHIIAQLAHHDAALAEPPTSQAEPPGTGHHQPPDAAQPHPEPIALSPREHEVLLLIAEGLSNREIADRLGVGSATAKSHVQRLLAKLHVDNRTQAAILAVRLGLLDPPR